MQKYSKRFSAMSPKEIHDIFALRSAVFVVEQNCVYQDIDGKDADALHLFIKSQTGQLMAYSRVFAKDKYHKGFVSIGRVVVEPDSRRKSLGKEIMRYSIDQCKKHFGHEPIKISAQQYLKEFYTELGFEYTGKSYLEDGIPHIEMIQNMDAAGRMDNMVDD